MPQCAQPRSIKSVPDSARTSVTDATNVLHVSRFRRSDDLREVSETPRSGIMAFAIGVVACCGVAFWAALAWIVIAAVRA